jgi:hypothetical protein
MFSLLTRRPFRKAGCLSGDDIDDRRLARSGTDERDDLMVSVRK